eukprot:7219238-Karenia_brevis.AAC.1
MFADLEQAQMNLQKVFGTVVEVMKYNGENGNKQKTDVKDVVLNHVFMYFKGLGEEQSTQWEAVASKFRNAKGTAAVNVVKDIGHLLLSSLRAGSISKQ